MSFANAKYIQILSQWWDKKTSYERTETIICSTSTALLFRLLDTFTLKDKQWRSQSEDLVPLCKYFRVH